MVQGEPSFSDSMLDPSLSQNTSFSHLNAQAPEFVPNRSPDRRIPASSAAVTLLRLSLLLLSMFQSRSSLHLHSQSRKAMDKERRLHAALEAKPEPPLSMDDSSELETTEESSTASSSSDEAAVLPEFHIGVIKDLASVDAAVREAAVEALATKLMEVQKVYEGLDNKELVEGGGVKLEAEKDDGSIDCAPSLRYALRRLILQCFFI